MSAPAAEFLGMRRPGLARRLVVLLAALAFALQSYATQTHIHDKSQAFNGLIKTSTTQSSSQDKTPADNNSSDCPLCQAVIHAGAVSYTHLRAHETGRNLVCR